MYFARAYVRVRQPSTPSPSRNVKPPKRYVGLKPHRRRSSSRSSSSCRPLFLSVPLYSLSYRPFPRLSPYSRRLLLRPPLTVPPRLAVSCARYMGEARGHCSHRLNAFGKHRQRRCANGSLFTLRILSAACGDCVCVSCSSKARCRRRRRRRRRKSRDCRARTSREHTHAHIHTFDIRSSRAENSPRFEESPVSRG